jgi:hypothetical protein
MLCWRRESAHRRDGFSRMSYAGWGRVRPGSENIAAFAGTEAFNLVHQLQNNLDAGEINSAITAQVLDLLKGSDARRIKEEAAIFRIDDGRDEPMFAADQHDVSRHSREMRGGVDRVKDIGGGGEPLQRVDVDFGFNVHDFYSFRVSDEEREDASIMFRRAAG